ncbi:MAG: hypothetical protein JSU66_12970 [Deltaproteobacteria bacterium]|nr:MAG: hypothetical protein JSU66_12970 [Deltaproteobacteria bacterium]
MTFALNVIISASLISFASWLSGRFPGVAGFLVAMPIATMLVLPLSYFEHGNPAHSIVLAKSILIAIPVSLTFFLPFLLSARLELSFWQAYGIGCALLPIGFFAHRFFMRLWFAA